MAKQNEKKKSAGTGWKEVIRKMLVSLKKNPQIIPLLALTISFLVLSLNLTDISNTTAKIYGKHMGLCAFISMLFSMLSYVCMFNAFPKRKKPVLPMILLLFVLYACVIGADVYYYNRIIAALTREVSPITITKSTAYILSAQNVMITHIVTVVITMLCVALEPVFAKLLKKINTSVDIEDNIGAGKIELSDEE